MFFKDLHIKDIADIPVLSLAYIGDAVYDLMLGSIFWQKDASNLPICIKWRSSM